MFILQNFIPHISSQLVSGLSTLAGVIDVDMAVLSAMMSDLALRGLSKKSRQFAIQSVMPYTKSFVSAAMLVRMMSQSSSASMEGLSIRFLTSLAGLAYLMHNDHLHYTHIDTTVHLPKTTETTEAVIPAPARMQQSASMQALQPQVDLAFARSDQPAAMVHKDVDALSSMSGLKYTANKTAVPSAALMQELKHVLAKKAALTVATTDIPASKLAPLTANAPTDHAAVMAELVARFANRSEQAASQIQSGYQPEIHNDRLGLDLKPSSFDHALSSSRDPNSVTAIV